MSARQIYKNIIFLSTSDTTNSSVSSIVITGGLSVQKNVMLSQNLSVGNITTTGITVGNLNLTGTLFNNGTLNTSSQWDGTTGNLIYFGSTGSTYVGINTSTPTFNLDVSGGARISTSITTGSLFSTNVTSTNIVGTNLSTGTIRSTNGTVSNFAVTSDLYVGGSLIAVNVTTLNLVDTNISTGSINSSVGITSAALLVTGLISSSNIFSTTATIPNIIHTNITTSSIKLNDNGVINIDSAGTGILVLIKKSGSPPSIASNNSFPITFQAANTTDGGAILTNTYTTTMTITSQGNVNIIGTGNAVAISTGNLFSTRGTIQNVVFTNVSTGTLNVSTLTATTSVSSGNLYSTNVTSTNIVGTNISTNSINLNSIIATTSVSSGNLYSTNVTSTNIVGTNLSTGTIRSTNGTVGNFAVTSDLYVGGSLIAVNVTTLNLIDTNISTGSINASVGITSSALLVTGLISTNNLTSTTATIPNVVFTNITTNSFLARANSSIINTGSTLSLSLTSISASTVLYAGAGDNKSYFQYLNDLNFSRIGGTTARIYIQATSGNVGISTPTPLFNLDVNGSIDAGTFLTSGNVYSTNVTSTNIVGTNISTNSINVNTLTGTTSTIPNVVFTNVSTGTLNVSTLTATTSVSSGNLYSTNVTSTNIVGTNISSGSLNSSVGITSAALLVTGSARLTNSSNTIGNVIISAAGIGINTVPGSSLDVRNSGSTQFNLQNTGTGACQLSLYSFTDSRNYFQHSGDLYFTAMGSTTQRTLGLTTNGNVNIGASNTYSPVSKLTISGGVNGAGGIAAVAAIALSADTTGYNHFITSRHVASANSVLNSIEFWLNNSVTQVGSTAPNFGNVNTMAVTAVGVGIFQSTPSYTLDVTGTGRFTTSIISSNAILTNITTSNIKLNENSVINIDEGSSGRLVLVKKAGGGPTIASNNTTDIIFQAANSTDASAVLTNSYTTTMTISSQGNVNIVGALSKGSGTFDIQHPLKNDKKERLIHSFIEGPRCDLIYRGTKQLINGEITVNIDSECNSNTGMSEGTFEALCINSTFYLQNKDSFDRVRGSISGNILTIMCENTLSNDNIDWMVIAERQDDFIKQWKRTDSNGYLTTEYREN